MNGSFYIHSDIGGGIMLKPTYVKRRVLDLDAEFLREHHIKGLILDLDNTLTTHNNKQPGDGITEWIAEMKSAGIKLIILSNNTKKRVTPFAELLGLEFEPNGAKPLAVGFRRAAKRLGLEKRNLAAVGDQIFTDILGATVYGIRTVFVTPIEPETGFLFKVKRVLEYPFRPKQ